MASNLVRFVKTGSSDKTKFKDNTIYFSDNSENNETQYDDNGDEIKLENLGYNKLYLGSELYGQSFKFPANSTFDQLSPFQIATACKLARLGQIDLEKDLGWKVGQYLTSQDGIGKLVLMNIGQVFGIFGDYSIVCGLCSLNDGVGEKSDYLPEGECLIDLYQLASDVQSIADTQMFNNGMNRLSAYIVKQTGTDENDDPVYGTWMTPFVKTVSWLVDREYKADESVQADNTKYKSLILSTYVSGPCNYLTEDNITRQLQFFQTKVEDLKQVSDVCDWDMFTEGKSPAVWTNEMAYDHTFYTVRFKQGTTIEAYNFTKETDLTAEHSWIYLYCI